MSKIVFNKQQGLSPLQVSVLNQLGDIYINYFSTLIRNESSKNMMSTNGAELQGQLNLCGLSYKRFFHSLEKRIMREFSNVKEAHFDFERFLSSGIYILHLTYAAQKAETQSEERKEDKRTTKISRNSCPALFTAFEFRNKLLNKGITTLQLFISLLNGTPNPSKSLDELSQGYCQSLGLTGLTEEERLKVFLEYQQRAYFSIYSPFHVEMVSQSFSGCFENIELPERKEWASLYELLGACSGILVLPEGIVEYAIMEDGEYMRFVEKRCLGSKTMYSFNGGLAQSLPEEKYNEFFVKARNVLIMKKYGSVETQVIEGREKRKFGKSFVVNKAPFPIHRLDGSWFKTIIRTEGFEVRGHWRLQACGKGWKEHKLVFIKSFQKHGYVRRAPALIAREAA